MNAGHNLGMLDDKNKPLVLFWNQTCTIRPQWVNVNVTYVRGGFVTLESMPQTLPDIPLTSSMIIQSAMSTLMNHFSNSQTMFENHIMNSIALLAMNELYQFPNGTNDSRFEKFIIQKMVSTHYTLAPSH
jgi:hypothetical protein